jgi:hypothetical protein
VKEASSQYHQAQITWQESVSRLLNVNEDFSWILHMSEYEEWRLEKSNKPLLIEYDSSRDWQVSLARVLEQDLQGQTELLWGFCPEHYNFRQLDDFKISLARSLIGQLITFRPDCIEKVQEFLQEMQMRPGLKFQAKQFAQQCQTVWKAPFSSNESTWQHHWALLAFVLKFTSHNTAIILIGFSNEGYVALDNGLKYLNAVSLEDSNWRSQLGPSIRVQGRFLVIGQPRRSYLQSIRICEDVEIKGSFDGKQRWFYVIFADVVS